MSIPHLFRCPISLDLFTDPVTLSTGQTYDRPSIEKWLADGNLTCPVTMQRLHDASMVPNHTLSHLIDRWLLAGPDPNSRHKTTTGLSLSTLEQNLRSPNTATSTKLETLRKIRILSVESDIGQTCLIQLGFFPLLCQLLFQSTYHDSELVEILLDCILSLSPSTHLDSLHMINKESNLNSLALLLDRGSSKIKTSLCYLLEVISTSQELCSTLGKTPRIIRTLILLLHNRFELSEAAVRAISGICEWEANHGILIGEGAVDGIVAYLSHPHRRNASRGLATLEVLLGVDNGKRVMSKDAVHVLVKMVFKVSSDHQGSEHAVGSLLIICRESVRMRAEAVNSGVVTQLLLLLQSQCTSKAKSKARALLKLLKSMWAV